MTNALILDGEQRAALAATRSLVRGGLQIAVASAAQTPLSGASAGVESCQAYPAPSDSATDFLAWVSRNCAPVALPVTDATTMLLRSASAQGDEGYEALTDKATLVAAAQTQSVPVPTGSAVYTVNDATIAAGKVGYPVALKPSRSKLLLNDRVISTSVRIASDRNDLEQFLEAASWFPAIPVIVQEFIPGHGAGVFCLYDRDHAIAWFAHRRIREKPPSGGVSVLCESVAVDPVLKDYAERLLRAAEYRGVAMVEFRIGTDGRPYLMEVNARFWGSLQLAIDCGVDFPWLYYQMLMGESVAPVHEYEVGRRLRWWLGDLDHVLLQIRNPALGVGEKIAVVGRFLGTSFDPRCRQEVFRWSDPGPGWLELRQWVAGVLGRSP